MTGDAEVTETLTAGSAPAGAATGRLRAQQFLAASARYALRSDDFEDLCATLLKQVVASFDGAVAGACWLQTKTRLLQPVHSEGFEHLQLKTDPGLSDVHGKVLSSFFGKGGTALWNADAAVQGQRLPFHLLLAAVEVDGAPRGVLEVVVEVDRPASSYEPYLNLLEAVAGLLSDWLNRNDRQSSNEQSRLLADADAYARQVHASLNLPVLCGVIVNEARRHVQADRATVAFGPLAPKVHSVSGQVTIDHRANQVVALNELIRRVAEFREPLIYNDTGEEAQRPELAPQVEQALDRYLDESFAKQLLIYPLRRPETDEAEESSDGLGRPPAGKRGQDLVGALVLECFEAEQPIEQLQQKAEGILGHTQNALANAAAFDRIPFMPFWRAVGRVSHTTPWARTLRTAGLVLIGAAVLLGWPTTFSVRAEGTLEPKLKREVFADVGGVVESVLVRHGQEIAVDQVLLEIRSPDLDVELADIAGRRRVAEEQARSEERKMVESRLGSVETHRLAGSRRAFVEQQLGLEKQQALLEQRRQRLKVRSNFNGEVITWDAGRRLMHRPVRKGDRLLTLADPTGPWELELFVQDRRLGHVLQAVREGAGSVAVEFILATHPTRRFVGRLREVHEISQHHNDHGWGALVHVDVDTADMPELRAGARVSAKIVCGRRSAGFTWFHEPIEWLASHVFF